jgi:hypothetical protein
MPGAPRARLAEFGRIMTRTRLRGGALSSTTIGSAAFPAGRPRFDGRADAPAAALTARWASMRAAMSWALWSIAKAGACSAVRSRELSASFVKTLSAISSLRCCAVCFRLTLLKCRVLSANSLEVPCAIGGLRSKRRLLSADFVACGSAVCYRLTSSKRRVLSADFCRSAVCFRLTSVSHRSEKISGETIDKDQNQTAIAAASVLPLLSRQGKNPQGDRLLKRRVQNFSILY